MNNEFLVRKAEKLQLEPFETQLNNESRILLSFLEKQMTVKFKIPKRADSYVWAVCPGGWLSKQTQICGGLTF